MKEKHVWDGKQYKFPIHIPINIFHGTLSIKFYSNTGIKKIKKMGQKKKTIIKITSTHLLSSQSIYPRFSSTYPIQSQVIV